MLTGRALCGGSADDAEEPGYSGVSRLADVVVAEDGLASGPLKAKLTVLEEETGSGIAGRAFQ
ncbi:unnamed protein product, partial [Bubo scandiacus]